MSSISDESISKRMALASFLFVAGATIAYQRRCKSKKESSSTTTRDRDSIEKQHLHKIDPTFHKVKVSTTASIKSQISFEDDGSNVGNVEILLHNISHKDFVVALQIGTSSALARPEFSHYNSVCESAFRFVDNMSSGVLKVIHHKVSHRSDHEIATSTNFRIPVGYDISADSTALNIEKGKLRIRYEEEQDPSHDSVLRVTEVYLPLISLLIPKWLAMIDAKTTGRSIQCKKVLVLVSGEGTPYVHRVFSPLTESTSDNFIDNSTEFSAKIIRLFVQQMYPDIRVIVVHSKTNVFRYDENISFVKNDLLPYVERYRNMLAAKWRDKWRDKFHLTLSLADGASARVSAINASLRYYRPSFMHFWQLKT
jgi:hypothetical protein